MNKENPEIFQQRFMTYEIIQELKKRYSISEVVACRIFYDITRKKHQSSGFALDDFTKFHNCYRQYKRKI